MGSRKKSILAIFKKKISHSIFGKNAVSPSIPAGTHKSSITVYIFGEELWCFPFREVPTNACFWFQFLAKKNNHVRMPSNDKFGQLLALRPIWYFTSANCLAFGQFHLCCEEQTTKHSSQREEASSLTDDTLSETAAYFPRQPSEHRWPS